MLEAVLFCLAGVEGQDGLALDVGAPKEEAPQACTSSVRVFFRGRDPQVVRVFGIFEGFSHARRRFFESCSRGSKKKLNMCKPPGALQKKRVAPFDGNLLKEK